MWKKNIFFLLLFFLAACSSTKRVGDKELLLVQNNVTVDQKKNKNSDLNKLLVQKPNSKILGFPLSLYFYNLGTADKSKNPVGWRKKSPEVYVKKSVFSEEQPIARENNKIGLNHWFLKNGQAPVIIDDEKIKRSVKNLTTYYKNNGFFRVNVRSKKERLRKKRGVVNYFINRGKPTYINVVKTNIKSPVLDSLYKLEKTASFLRSGDQYFEANFIKEAKRITYLYRNNGIYYFTENDLGFYNVDSTDTNNYRTDIDLIISDKKRAFGNNGESIFRPYTIQKIRKVTVFTDYSFSKKDNSYLDSIRYRGVLFLAHEKIKYNPKLLFESIFITPNDIYSDSLRYLTRKHLKSLKNFKLVDIQYKTVENADNLLDVTISLTPLNKFSLDLETELTHSNIRDLGVSGKFSFINRNSFKGAEIFKLSFLSSFFNASQDANNEARFFNSWEIGADFSLEFPKLIGPFRLDKSVSKRMSPRTVFTLGTSIQKNIGLDRQTLTALIDYKWEYNSKKKIQLEVFNTQYVRNLRIENYFDIYNSEFVKLNEIAKVYNNGVEFPLLEDETKASNAITFMNIVATDTRFGVINPDKFRENLNVLNRYTIITSDFIIPTIAYSLTYNNQENFRDNNFSFFKFRVANSGNISWLFSSKANDNKGRTIFNIPLAQYFKTDIEYKKFWEIDDSSVFGFRSAIGVIIPYNNSAIPFTKSYFAGGSNDIRAWQTYGLGPGRRNSGLEYNIGSFKFLTNAEYRFNLFGNLKGGLFLDAGNIWDITNSIFVEEKAKFSGTGSVKDIAVGSGFGFRYDFSFLVFRLDIGFKMHEPYLEGNKWFKNHNFSNAVYNVGINYPF